MKKQTIKRAALSLAVMAALTVSLQAEGSSNEIDWLASNQTVITEDHTSGGTTGLQYSNGVGNLVIGNEEHSVTVSANTSGAFYDSSVYDPKQKYIPSSGVLIKNGNVGSITVSEGSKVSGLNGISVVITNNYKYTVGDVTNEGSIASQGSAVTTPGSSLFVSNSGLFLGGVNNNGSPLMTVGTVKNIGSISSEAGAGLMVGMGTTVKEIVNSGSISGGTDGIRVYYKNISNGWYSSSAVTNGLTTTSSVSGGTFGLRIDDGANNSRKISFGDVKVSGSGASITGGSIGFYIGNYASVGEISLTSGASITGNGSWANGIQVQNNASINSISLSDSTISGSDSGLVINGKNSVVSGGIKLSSGSSITGVNQGVYTAGKISGGVTLDSGTSISGQNNAGLWNGGSIGKIDTSTYDTSSYQNAAIIVSGTASITSRVDGIRNGVDSGSAVIDGSIYIDSGATVTGTNGSGYGINNWKNASINGDIISSGTLSGVNNAGTITGKIEVKNAADSTFWFSNSGTVSGAVSIDASGVITAKNYGSIASGWAISGASGSSLLNAGTVSGNLTFETPGDLTVSNQSGSNIKGKFEVNASGGTVNFVNFGAVSGQLSVTATGTSGQNIVQNAASVGSGFTVSVSGSGGLQLVNNGNVSGNFTSTSIGNVSGGNTGAVSGDLTVKTTNGSMNFTNTGNVTGKVEITNKNSTSEVESLDASSINNVIQNSGVLSSGLSLDLIGSINLVNQGNVSGGLSVTNNAQISGSNSGKVTGALTLKTTSGSINFTNTGDVTSGFTITNIDSTQQASGIFVVKGTDAPLQNVVQNAGAITSGFSINLDGALDLVNQGAISGNLTVSNNSSFSGSNTGNVTGKLEIQSSGTVNFVNSGSVGSGFSVTNFNNKVEESTLATTDNVVQNTGAITGDLKVDISGGLTLVNTGNVSNDFVSTSTSSLSGANSGNISGSLTVTANGAVNFVNSGSVGSGFSVTNFNNKVGQSTLAVTDNVVQNTGAITGDLKVDISGGLTLVNTGKVSGNFTSTSTSSLSGGNSGNISGSLTVKANGTVNFLNSGSVGSGFSVTNFNSKDVVGPLAMASGFDNVVQNTGAITGKFDVNISGSLNLVNTGNVSGDFTSTSTSSLSGGNSGNISGSLTVNASGAVNFVNSGSVSSTFIISNHTTSSEALLGVLGTSHDKSVIQNTGTLSSGLTANIIGDLTLINTGAITGDLKSVESTSFSGSNSGKVSGNVTITANSGAVNFTNTGDVTGQFEIKNSGNTAANVVKNGGALSNGMNVTVSGALTLQNSGKITGSITSNNDGAVSGWNSGVVSQNISITTTSGAINYTNQGNVSGHVSLTSSGGSGKSTVGNTATIASGLEVSVQGALDFANEGAISNGLTLSSKGAVTGYNSGAVTGTLSITTTSGAFNFSNSNTVTGQLKLTSEAGTAASTVSNSSTITEGVDVNVKGGLNFTNSGSVKGTVALSASGASSVTNQSTISGLLTLNGSVSTINFVNSGDFTAGAKLSGSSTLTGSNSSTVTGQLEFTGITSSEFTNTGNLKGGLTISHLGEATFDNAGQQTGAILYSGQGDVTVANRSGASLSNLTLTDATSAAITNYGALTGTISVTSNNQIKGTAGDFTLLNYGSSKGSINATGVQNISITNAGEGATMGSTLNLSGTGNITLTNQADWTSSTMNLSGAGDVLLTNVSNWSGDLSITGAKAISVTNKGIFSGDLSISANSGDGGQLTFENSSKFDGNVTLSFKNGDDNPSTLLNTGIYSGTMTLNGSGRLEVTSTGFFTGKIIRNGSGDIDVKEWHVIVTDTGSSAECENCNRVTPVEVQDQEKQRSSDNVTIEKVIIAHAIPDQTNPSLSIDLNDVWEVNNQGAKPQDADLGDDAKAVGFKGYYTYNDGIFHTSFDTGVTAGAIISKTMASQLFRRDFFLEAAVNEAAVGALYHRRMDNIKGSVFVKPYTSYDSFEEDGVTASGHTQGAMAGATAFLGRHIITGLVGFERSQMDSKYITSDLDLDMQSWYMSLMTSHIIYAAKYVDVFGKVTAKVAYTTADIDRTLDQSGLSEASTHSLSYGANAQVGLNIRGIPNGNLIPMFGVGYSTGTTKAYQLDKTGVMNDKYTPSRVHLPFADASVTWFQSWNAYIKTFLSAGYRYNFKPEQDTQVSFGSNAIEGTYELPRHYEYINYSTVIHMTKDSEIAVGYTGVRDSMGMSHNLTTKYEIHF